MRQIRSGNFSSPYQCAFIIFYCIVRLKFSAYHNEGPFCTISCVIRYTNDTGPCIGSACHYIISFSTTSSSCLTSSAMLESRYLQFSKAMLFIQMPCGMLLVFHIDVVNVYRLVPNWYVVAYFNICWLCLVDLNMFSWTCVRVLNFMCYCTKWGYFVVDFCNKRSGCMYFSRVYWLYDCLSLCSWLLPVFVNIPHVFYIAFCNMVTGSVLLSTAAIIFWTLYHMDVKTDV